MSNTKRIPVCSNRLSFSPAFRHHDSQSMICRYTLLATLLISASIVQLSEADMQPTPRGETRSDFRRDAFVKSISWCTLYGAL